MKAFKNKLNRGFTLVELIVTIALLTIVGGAITGFIVVSQNSYNKGAQETDLQTEAQRIVNQFQDLLIDATNGLSYCYETTDEDGNKTTQYISSDFDGSFSKETKSFYVYDAELFYRITWDAASKKLYYHEYKVGETATNNVAAFSDSDANEYLFGEFVSSFYVDISEVQSKDLVKFQLTLTKDSGATYTTAHEIKLRNKIIAYTQNTNIYDEVPANGKYTLTIGPDMSFVWQGETVTLQSLVSSDNGKAVSQSINWIINDTMDSNTGMVGNSTLQVGSNEHGKVESGNPMYYFTMTASKTYDFNGNGTIESDETITPVNGSILIMIRKLTGLRFFDNAGYASDDTKLCLDDAGNSEHKEEHLINAGQELKITADLLGFNVSDLSTAEKGGVTFTVSPLIAGLADDAYYTVTQNDSDNGLLTLRIKPDTEVFSGVNSTKDYADFRVTATSLKDPSLSASMVYRITKQARILITASDGWKRYGAAQVNLDFLNPDLATSHSGTRDYGLIEYMVYYGSDFKPYPNYPDATFSNMGGWGPVMYTDSYINFNFAPGVLNSASVYLQEFQHQGSMDSFNKLSFSSPYYPNYDYNYDMELYDASITKVLIRVSYMGGLQTGEVELELPGVDLELRNSDPAIFPYENEEENNWQSDKLVVYITPNDSMTDNLSSGEKVNYRNYRTYFRLVGGWSGSADYYILPARYVGKVVSVNGVSVIPTNASEEKRLDLFNKDTKWGVDSGVGYIDLKLNKDKISEYCTNKYVVQEIYEYNSRYGTACSDPNFKAAPGYSFGYPYSSDANYQLLQNVKGCEGIIEYHFVDSNVSASVHKLPPVAYIPTFDELRANHEEMVVVGGSAVYSYYIDRNNRFVVFKDGDVQKAEYQQVLANGTWAKKCSYVYTSGVWVENCSGNVFINYHEANSPASMYCPTYEEAYSGLLPMSNGEYYFKLSDSSATYDGRFKVSQVTDINDKKVDVASYQLRVYDEEGNSWWEEQYKLFYTTGYTRTYDSTGKAVYTEKEGWFDSNVYSGDKKFAIPFAYDFDGAKAANLPKENGNYKYTLPVKISGNDHFDYYIENDHQFIKYMSKSGSYNHSYNTGYSFVYGEVNGVEGWFRIKKYATETGKNMTDSQAGNKPQYELCPSYDILAACGALLDSDGYYTVNIHNVNTEKSSEYFKVKRHILDNKVVDVAEWYKNGEFQCTYIFDEADGLWHYRNVFYLNTASKNMPVYCVPYEKINSDKNDGTKTPDSYWKVHRKTFENLDGEKKAYDIAVYENAGKKTTFIYDSASKLWLDYNVLFYNVPATNKYYAEGMTSVWFDLYKDVTIGQETNDILIYAKAYALIWNDQYNIWLDENVIKSNLFGDNLDPVLRYLPHKYHEPIEIPAFGTSNNTQMYTFNAANPDLIHFISANNNTGSSWNPDKKLYLMWDSEYKVWYSGNILYSYTERDNTVTYFMHSLNTRIQMVPMWLVEIVLLVEYMAGI